MGFRLCVGLGVVGLLVGWVWLVVCVVWCVSEKVLLVKLREEQAGLLCMSVCVCLSGFY